MLYVIFDRVIIDILVYVCVLNRRIQSEEKGNEGGLDDDEDVSDADIDVGIDGTDNDSNESFV